MTDKKFLKARAPAKIILSGEHAVVYGHPALAMAINRYTEARVRWSTPFHFTFNLMGIDFKQSVTLEALKRLKKKLKSQYQQFSSGDINIRDVLKNPFELTLYTAINVIERLKHKLPMGIDFDTNSNIPIGCGLGSSAACVVSVITALSHLLEIDMDLEDYIRLAIESENLQHGFSSGLDIQMSYKGGAFFYERGNYQRRPLPQFAMTLIHTGQPVSSTGECVAQAKHFFTHSKIGDDFATITKELDTAITANNMDAIKNAIRLNHQLLKNLKVVPDKVCHYISEIEKLGGAAKICGAGSIYGDAAGVLMAICPEKIDVLTQKFGYNSMPIKGDNNGVTVL